MNGTVKIRGGVKLMGEVTPIPNKNSLMAALPAAILARGGVLYHNVPKTTDVEKFLTIYEKLGARIEWKDEETILVNTDEVKGWQIDEKVGGSFRSAFMFVGPLLARFGKAEVPVPGGCLLGTRSVSAHIDGFVKMGVNVALKNGFYCFTAPRNKRKNYRVWQLEASVTATENLAMYASGIESCIEIIDAASEPHVSDLLMLLANMGAKIEGIGSNRLVIKGKNDLRKGEFCPSPDHIDIAGYMTAAGVTGGRIVIKGANIANVVDGLIEWFEMFGMKIEKKGADLIVCRDGSLRIKEERGFPMAGQDLPKLVPRPWPGFPVDALPAMVTLAAKSRGRLMVQNWMYESGLDFVRELNEMGADIFMADPQRLIVHDKVVRFKGGNVAPPKIIQATKAVFLAALADPVETTIHGVDILRRRYPDIVETYKKLGADIEWV